MASVSFSNQKNLFFRTLKEKVDNYFINNKLSMSGGRKIVVKGALLVSTAIIIYIALVFFTPIWPVSIFLCCLFGINLAMIGFNVMHEGGHQSFSDVTWLNKATSYFLNAMGGNIYYWKIKHNINHHTFTNVEGLDSDINVKPLMRLQSDQRRLKLHKFQHIYWFVLYGLSYLSWIFIDDFNKYFSRNISAGYQKQKLSVKEHFIFWLTKIFYISVYIFIPILMVGVIKLIVGYIIMGFVCGLFLAIIFQLAHIVESTDFPTVNESTHKIEEQWAIHQVNTTSDFATRSKFISWIAGGLNFQVEHHLFPKISHIHYPKISQLVKETCAEFNIVYHEYPTIFKAIHSHLRYIKKMGRA